MSTQFKSFAKRGQIRKRKAQSSSSDSDESEPSIVQASTKKQIRGLVQSTFRGEKKVVSHNQSSSDEDEAANTVLINESYKSSRSGKSDAPSDMGATSHLELDTKQDRDSLAVIERAKKQAEIEKEKETNGKSQTTPFPFYQGNAMNTDAVKRGQRYGPQRAPLNIRSTTRWDYAPDICKDYKETGHCGFGDSCKFLHDRSDYKFGWQVDREADAGVDGDSRNYEIPDEDEFSSNLNSDEITTCVECRGPLQEPVKSRCEHIFCMDCFQKLAREKASCPECSRNIDGFAQHVKNFKQKSAHPT